MKNQEKIIKKLSEAWIKEPNWRLGQLIFNLTGQYDCFHVQDKELEKALDKFNKNYQNEKML